MRRFEVIKAIVSTLDDELVVCNLGFPSRELFSIRDSERNFYMLGSMGLASSIALGLSLGTQQTVVAIDGDGSVLMNLGTLSTIANYAPANLILVIIDNSSYGSTGDQPTHTGGVTNLADIARGAGVRSVFHIEGTEVEDVLLECRQSSGPHVIVVRAVPGSPELPLIPLSPVFIRDRFMHAVTSQDHTDGSPARIKHLISRPYAQPSDAQHHPDDKQHHGNIQRQQQELTRSLQPDRPMDLVVRG